MCTAVVLPRQYLEVYRMILRKRGRNFLRVVKMKKDGVSFSMGKPLQSHILFRTAKAEKV